MIQISFQIGYIYSCFFQLNVTNFPDIMSQSFKALYKHICEIKVHFNIL